MVLLVFGCFAVQGRQKGLCEDHLRHVGFLLLLLLKSLQRVNECECGQLRGAVRGFFGTVRKFGIEMCSDLLVEPSEEWTHAHLTSSLSAN